jgi:MFS family permease
MSDSSNSMTAPNAKRLLWAGFMAILAAGVGYSVRGGILGQWAEQFGFTMTDLGKITGGGLTGFGVVIILSSLIADKVGYGKLLFGAFILHVISAAVTLAAPAAFASGGKEAAYNCLFWGMFIFAVGNGLCEAVVNPLTATLFPNNKAHYLNVLHAGWPAGLVVGGLASAFMAAKPAAEGVAAVAAVPWTIQMSLFLVPVIFYGVMLFGQKFPKSEVSSAGVSLGGMLASIATPLMLVLIVTHALVGYVELGTDSWISKITGTILASPAAGLKLFVYTSLLMFGLRFVAGPIVHKVSPLGLLLISSVLGFLGLHLLGSASTVVACVIAATVYACGKTFLWPTMLAVVSERFPKGGAVAIGLIGGVGMLSAGLLGGPAIGFKQDFHASANLKETTPAAYERYKADKENSFMSFSTVGLDGAKVGVLGDDGAEVDRVTALLAKEGKKDENHEKLATWWSEVKPLAKEDKEPVNKAGIVGGQMALKLTSYVPLTMAGIFLLLVIYFRAKGGYKPLTVDSH